MATKSALNPRKLAPFTSRDFRQGRITQNKLTTFLAPQNSVKESVNVNFDDIVGQGVVRSGTTPLNTATSSGVKWSDWNIFRWSQKTTTTWKDVGPTLVQGGSPVASGYRCLGAAEFSGVNGTPYLALAVFQGATTATLYYFDTSWHASDLLITSNNSEYYFAILGGRVFVTDPIDGMRSSLNGANWGYMCCIDQSIKPTTLGRYKGRLLAATPDVVWFSSIIDQSASPFIAWNVNTSSGDFIKVNPDDGGSNIGFAETSTYVLDFKDTGMYRTDIVSKTVDPDNIFNIGAISQKAIIVCQGVCYFFSGLDVRSTVGDYPAQISRLGFQDIIDAIPQENWKNVSLGTDGLNVYVSVGTVTINQGENTQKTITNCVGKYSPRDQSWSVHSYAQQPRFFFQFTNVAGRFLHFGDTAGYVQAMNYGTTDNGTPIYYNLESQDLEFGNRDHLDQLSDHIVVYSKNGSGSSVQFRINGKEDFTDVNIDMENRVAIGDGISIQGYFFNFRWLGQSTSTPPVFEGYSIIDITDVGVTEA